MLRRSAKPGWFLVDGKDRYWDGKKWLETQDMSDPGWYEVIKMIRDCSKLSQAMSSLRS